MMLCRAGDNNIYSFACIWLVEGNQHEFRKHPKIKWLDGGHEWPFSFRMLTEFVLISLNKPDARKTLKTASTHCSDPV